MTTNKPNNKYKSNVDVINAAAREKRANLHLFAESHRIPVAAAAVAVDHLAVGTDPDKMVGYALVSALAEVMGGWTNVTAEDVGRTLARRRLVGLNADLMRVKVAQGAAMALHGHMDLFNNTDEWTVEILAHAEVEDVRIRDLCAAEAAGV